MIYSNNMQVDRISVSLPHSIACFMNSYQKTHRCKSRSEVIQKALNLLQEIELECAYREATLENEVDPAFEITTSDGLQDEAW